MTEQKPSYTTHPYPAAEETLVSAEHPGQRAVSSAVAGDFADPKSPATAPCPVTVFRDDEPTVLRDGTHATVIGWGVLWYGKRHGGRHYQYVEALDHAEKLMHAPAWDRDGWIAMHGVAA